MRLLRILLPLLVLLLGSTAARAQYNPTDPPEPGVFFTLSARAVPADGGYSISGGGTYAFGSNVSMRVSTTTGYRFLCWEDEDGNVVSSSQNFTYVMPPRNVSLIARFVYDPSSPSEPVTPEFKDISIIDFKVSPAEAGYFSTNYNGEYEVGTSHSFTVRQNSNYKFVNWTRNGMEVGTSMTINYTVPRGDHTLVANFVYDPSNPSEPGVPIIPRKLTLKTNLDGAASLSGAGEHLAGSTVSVSARANTYFHFVNWTDEEGNIVSETSQFNYTVPDRNVTLTANYTYDYNPSNPVEPGTPNPDSGMAENMVLWPRFGMYDDTHVLILCETPGATIHYTLDGSVPNAESPVYTSPIYVESNLLVRAIAYKEGMEDSPVVSYRVTAYHASAPFFRMKKRLIEIASDTPGATIHYTVDFSTPNEESEIYSTPFEPEENCRIKAYARKDGLTDSSISVFVYRRADYVIPAPTFSLNEDGMLVITANVAGGQTYFTADGTEPDEDSELYTQPIELSGYGVIKAYTVHPDYFDSPVADYSYSIVNVDVPVVTPQYRERLISIDHPSQCDVIVSIDGEEHRLATPAEIEVTPGMSHLSVIAVADSASMFRSEPVEMPIVFHLPPAIDYDGHAVHYGPAEGDPEPAVAEASIYMDDALRHSGIGKQSYEIYEMALLKAVMESDHAFRSDTIAMPIDYYNTGLRVAARNGHRISEGFGTWGDKLEDYTVLEVSDGTIEKEDLEFLGSLPSLKALYLWVYIDSDKCDGVFAGSPIEYLSVLDIPEGLLIGMDRLTTIAWAFSNVVMPNGRLSEAANPNIILWVEDKDLAPADAVNLVVENFEAEDIRGTAERITLTPGYPFATYGPALGQDYYGYDIPIDVKEISLTKEFSMPTEIGVCAGWESIVLPFTPDSIVHESGDLLVPISSWNGPTEPEKPFWLYSSNAAGWEAADTVKAGTPYIISMPNNPEYMEGYSLPGKVTFVAHDVTIGPDTEAKATEWVDGTEFVGTFMPVEDEEARSLNVNVAAGRDWLGSAFVDEDVTLPFGAYVRGRNLPRQIPVFGDWSGVMTPTADPNYRILVEAPAPGTIRVSAMRDCKVDIVSPDGALVRSLTVKAGGSVTAERLTRGLYICAGHKLMVR